MQHRGEAAKAGAHGYAMARHGVDLPPQRVHSPPALAPPLYSNTPGLSTESRLTLPYNANTETTTPVHRQQVLHHGPCDSTPFATPTPSHAPSSANHRPRYGHLRGKRVLHQHACMCTPLALGRLSLGEAGQQAPTSTPNALQAHRVLSAHLRPVVQQQLSHLHPPLGTRAVQWRPAILH